MDTHPSSLEKKPILSIEPFGNHVQLVASTILESLQPTPSARTKEDIIKVVEFILNGKEEQASRILSRMVSIGKISSEHFVRILENASDYYNSNKEELLAAPRTQTPEPVALSSEPATETTLHNGIPAIEIKNPAENEGGEPIAQHTKTNTAEVIADQPALDTEIITDTEPLEQIEDSIETPEASAIEAKMSTKKKTLYAIAKREYTQKYIAPRSKDISLSPEIQKYFEKKQKEMDIFYNTKKNRNQIIEGLIKAVRENTPQKTSLHRNIDVVSEFKDAHMYKKLRDIITTEGIDVILIHGKENTRGATGDSLSFDDDTDTKAALHILHLVNPQYKEGAHTHLVPKGYKLSPEDPEFAGKNILSIDVGGTDYGITLTAGKKGAEHIILDHHQEHAQAGQQSAASLMLTLIRETGLIENLSPEQRAEAENIGAFVNTVDDLTYPFNAQKDGATWPYTLYGLEPYTPKEILFSLVGKSAPEKFNKPLDPQVLARIPIGKKVDGRIIFAKNAEERAAFAQDPEFRAQSEQIVTDLAARNHELHTLLKEKVKDPQHKERVNALRKKISTLAGILPAEYITLGNQAERARRDLAASLYRIRNLAQVQKENGLATHTPDLGKVLVNKYKGGEALPLGFNAVRAAGYDSYLNFFTKEKIDGDTKTYDTVGFFVSSDHLSKYSVEAIYPRIKELFPEAKMIRGKMIMYTAPEGQEMDPEKLLQALELIKQDEALAEDTAPETQITPEALPEIIFYKGEQVRVLSRDIYGRISVEKSDGTQLRIIPS
ncbi:MAG: hypothetical protein LRY44_02565 [Candidatus Pacebacteria bacterium]|nr:hypothetical protein [Candidatus Paceibacterota bacterium]